MRYINIGRRLFAALVFVAVLGFPVGIGGIMIYNYFHPTAPTDDTQAIAQAGELCENAQKIMETSPSVVSRCTLVIHK